MKNVQKIISIYTLLAVFVLTQGCRSDFFDLNENPNLVQNPPINAMLSTVTHKTGLNSQRVASFVSYYTQYIANPSAGGAADTYQVTDNRLQWNNLYYAMADIYDMRNLALEVESSEHLGVANVLMAYHISLVSDIWGDAPFSDAFGGTTLTPVYDSQESLYQSALSFASEAITELQKTDSNVKLAENEDFIHGGDRSAWLRTAYAIQARLLNKISKKEDYDPQAVLTAVDNSYTSNADDAGMGIFEGVNPWAQIARNNDGNLLGGWLSDNWVNHLNGETYGLFDPRIEKITDKTVHDEYVGTRNGEGNTGAANTIKDECYISENSPFTAPDASLLIISYAEMKFIEAEAAHRAGDMPRAYDAYLEGIRASMEKLEVEEGPANTYINNPIVSVGSGNLTLDLIFKEKYVVTYLNPEAWNDMRRHNYEYEGFRLPLGAVLDEPIRRVAYPAEERAENGRNVPDEVPLSTRLWWDEN
ncbi:SusD/RagB family nutrient-binding outer membrane lipoprotein [Sinomicrobium sp. M5D2P9]